MNGVEEYMRMNVFLESMTLVSHLVCRINKIQRKLNLCDVVAVIIGCIAMITDVMRQFRTDGHDTLIHHCVQ